MKKFAMSRRAWMVTLAAVIAAPIGMATVTPVQAADDPPIVQYMEDINTAYKLLRRTARRKNFDADSMKQATDLVENSKKAREAKIPFIEKMPEAKREDAYKKYKEIMDKQIKAGNDLLAALKAKDNDKAAQIVDDLGAIKKEGHDAFVPE